jgi:toxin FitB
VTATVALDTSVAVPLLVRDHRAHREVAAWSAGHALALCGHAVAETYAVLTRLPGGLRLAPQDAATLLERRFTDLLSLTDPAPASLPGALASRAIAGGAVYDALVGLCAVEHGLVLATRDARARPTYQAVGCRVEVAG